MDFELIYNELVKLDIGTILKNSALSEKLIQFYKVLYNNGQNAGRCERSRHYFYLCLQKNGKEKMENYKQIQNRTFKLKWSGIKFINHKQIHSEYINDLQAIELLNSGYLTESDFVTLPQGYKVETKEIETVTEIKRKNTFKKKA